MHLRPSGWQAELTLGFAPGPGSGPGHERTLLAELRHQGPLRVQRPFYPQDDGTCHVYLLHPPGGLVGGDTLAIDVDVAADARALVTTPAAGKFYRSERRWAVQTQRLRVAAGASLEWLPQENIFFSGSWSRVSTRVELAEGAVFFGWETTVLGRPAADEAFARGSCLQSFELERAGRPLWLERGRYDGGDDLLGDDCGLGGRSACGTFVCVGAGERLATLVPELRARLAAEPAAPRERHGVTLLGDVLVVRALADSGHDVRARFVALWARLRAELLGSPAVAPRVWAT